MCSSPGHKKDDDVLYGSANPDEPIDFDNKGRVSGAGSHFPKSAALAGDPGPGSGPSIVGDPGPGSEATGGRHLAKSSGIAGDPGPGSGPSIATREAHDLDPRAPSRMPGTFDDNDAATTASVKSGIPGQAQSANVLEPSPDSHGGSTHEPNLPQSVPTASSGLATSSPQHSAYENTPLVTSHKDPRMLSSSSAIDDNSGLTSTAQAPGQSQNPAHGVHSGADTSATIAPTKTGHDIHGADTRGSQLSSSFENDNSGVSRFSGVGGPTDWKHEHGAHGHKFEGDPCGPGAHITQTANRLDPHISSEAAASNFPLGTGTTQDNSQSLGAATERTPTDSRSANGTASLASFGDTALTGTRGNLGQQSAGSTGPAPNTAGPHKADILNKADPRVDSDLSKQRDVDALGAQQSATTGTPARDHTSVTHDVGRDAGLAGAGVGGVTAFESTKDRHSQEPASRGSALTQRNIGLANTTGAGPGPTPSTTLPASDTRTGLREPPPTPAKQPHDSGEHAAYTQSSSAAVNPQNTSPPTSARDDHLRRDVALGGAGLGGAGLAAEKVDKGHTVSSSDTPLATSNAPDQTVRPRQTAAIDDRTRPHQDTHTDHQGPLAAGAGLGAGALATHEVDEKEARKLEKAHEKEIKQAEKAHDKEVKHAEKSQEKDVKKHQTVLDKEEKKQHEAKEIEEKKPSLVHRLLHRHDDDGDRTDKEVERKEQPALRDPDTGYPVHASKPKDKERGVEEGTEDSMDRQQTGGSVEQAGPGKTTHEAYQTQEGHNKLHKKNVVLGEQHGV